jgi:hypothetical protein
VTILTGGCGSPLDGWLEEHELPNPPRAAVVLATHKALANAIEHSDSRKPRRLGTGLGDSYGMSRGAQGSSEEESETSRERP